MAVWVPPDCPVDVHVLDKQGHQQIKEEQELKEQTAVQRQLGDPRVTNWLWGDEGRERGGQTHRVTASDRKQRERQGTWSFCQEQFFLFVQQLPIINK